MMRTLLPFAILLIAGCTGMTTKEIRLQQPMLYQESSRTSSEITRCLTESDVFQKLSPDRARVLTFPDGKSAEISFGAMQLGDFKTHYLISIKGHKERSTVEVRKSEANYLPINAQDFEASVRACLK